jgi:hypothetical protein
MRVNGNWSLDAVIPVKLADLTAQRRVRYNIRLACRARIGGMVV